MLPPIISSAPIIRLNIFSLKIIFDRIIVMKIDSIESGSAKETSIDNKAMRRKAYEYPFDTAPSSKYFQREDINGNISFALP
ncbi:hypothetical protein ES708_01618 [subsurface metagenome]